MPVLLVRARCGELRAIAFAEAQPHDFNAIVISIKVDHKNIVVDEHLHGVAFADKNPRSRENYLSERSDIQIIRLIANERISVG